APPDKVWSAITEVEAYPTWRPGVKSVERISSAPLTWKEANTGGDMTLEAEVFEPPRRMVARIQDQGMPFGGAWEYAVEPGADTTTSTVTITERGWVSNPIFRFVSKYVMGHHSSL